MRVFDAHADTLMHVVDRGRDIGMRLPVGHLDLSRMLESGWRAQMFACWPRPGQGAARVDAMIDALERTSARNHDRLGIARTAAEVERIVDSGRVAAVITVEGGHAIEDDLGTLRRFFGRGVRAMTLTWNHSPSWADGCGEPPLRGGLTRFGEEVVREMQSMGMLVDVSHAHEETFWAVMRTADRPVYASHSNARALCDHRRNLRDEQLRAVASRGGVIGINFYTTFVSESCRRLRPADVPEEMEERLPRARFDELIDHFEHVARVAGIEHVCFGSDFDGATNFPAGVEDCRSAKRIADALKARGFSDRDVERVTWSNLLRFFGDAGPR